MSKNKLTDYSLIVLSSLFFTLPFLYEQFSFLAWFFLIPLLFALDRKLIKNPFKTGLIFGTMLNYLGQYWLVGTLSRFGGFPLPAGVLFILVYCLFLGIQYGIFTYLVSKFKLLDNPGIKNILLASAVWAALEYFYPQLFPYSIGNSQGLNINVIQVVDILGVHFLSFIIVFINLSLYSLLKSMKTRGAKPVAAVTFSVILLVFLLAYGSFRIKTESENILKAEKIEIGLVQANFDFLEKIENNSGLIIETHKKMSLDIKDADLIIWPESAVLEFLPPDSEYLEIEGRMVIPEIENTYFLTGGLSFEVLRGNSALREGIEILQYNSAFLTDSAGKILGRYNKIKLLLFGEYLPFSDLIPAIKKLSPASGDFTPGSTLNILNIFQLGIKIGPLICYEDILPRFSREFSRKGANILINLTNDAWFGESFAPYQHLLVAVPRAVETRRYLIRSTNTGVSAIIDSTGRITSSTGIFTEEVIRDKVALLYGDTIYTRVGDIFPWICLATFVLFVFNNYLRRRYS